MSNNNQSNSLIRNTIILMDFILLNVLLFLFCSLHEETKLWSSDRLYVLFMSENMAMLLSQWKFSTIAHLRKITAADILRRVTWLIGTQTVIVLLFMKVITGRLPFIGQLIRVALMIAPALYLMMILVRYMERAIIKKSRQMGRNTRAALFIGSDPALLRLFKSLVKDPTLGYNITGYYADRDMEDIPDDFVLTRLGDMDMLRRKMKDKWNNFEEKTADEFYCSLPRSQKDDIRRIARYCDNHVIRFYYVPIEMEDFGLNLKREQLDDMEIFTPFQEPLLKLGNRILKRCFDIVFALGTLAVTAVIYPIVALIIKRQSPGPIFFKQQRTGLNGRTFWCYKFRSMHVNKDADTVQATKDDPRKFAFGEFMRKCNIDELPQFWNVLIGDMSVVGPRPHMLKHTEEYSALIDKYMVRHFVKPGITGWAQVTGFRGETKELWQMEERVKRDIWYTENWSFWLDIRIIWLTVKSIFKPDKNAY